ncbi:MAG TPA: hypothetical protein VHG91_18110, partial [Longimicrobium sp.]|nr:hypothetical protein [Longimicrobium sp.]
ALAAACADAPAERLAAPGAPSAATIAATVDLRRVVDSVTAALVPKNSGEYVVPYSTTLANFRRAVDSITAGRITGADALLDPHGYDVYRVREATTGDTLVFMRERVSASTGIFARGWGLYVYNPRARHDADIHVNHPVADQHTEDIAADLYRECRCRWLLMAGTHRNANLDGDTASDMARHTNTVFHQVHVAVAEPGTRAVSIHGFRRSTTDLPSGVDQVLSNGRSSATTTPTYLPADTVLRRRLRSAGFVAGLFRFDAGYDELGAASNPQGRHSNDTLGWGHWIHVENDSSVRADTVQWQRLSGVVRQWIADYPAP